ncbi:hypothetical protein Tco_0535036 [Tanacetum coccineum]
MIDYALWELIENGATLPKTQMVEGVMIVMPITFAEDKAQRRLEVKARSTLIMGIPNEHHNMKTSLLQAQRCLIKPLIGFKACVSVGACGLKVLKKFNQIVIKKLVTEWKTLMPVSVNEEEDVSQPKIEKKIVIPSIVKKEFVKSKQQEKSTRKTVKQVEQHRQNTYSPRGNQRNWNNMMSQKLGSNFEMFNKPLNAGRPKSYLSKTAYSTVKRPIHKNTTFKNSNIDKRVNTVSGKKINTARRKAMVNDIKENSFNAVKASACWVWKSKTKVLDHVSKQNSASITLKKFDYIDAQDRPKHMTGNMSYLTNYEEIDRGYVAFRGNPKGGKITGKGTQSNGFAFTKASDNAVQARKETKPVKNYILLPLWTVDPPYSQDPKSSHYDGSKPSSDDKKKVDEDPRKDSECND